MSEWISVEYRFPERAKMLTYLLEDNLLILTT